MPMHRSVYTFGTCLQSKISSIAAAHLVLSVRLSTHTPIQKSRHTSMHTPAHFAVHRYGMQSKDYMWHLAVVHARVRGWIHLGD